jgi:hypothetical protein
VKRRLGGWCEMVTSLGPSQGTVLLSLWAVAVRIW